MLNYMRNIERGKTIMNNSAESRELLTAALITLDSRIPYMRAELYCLLVELGLYKLNRQSSQEEIKSEINQIIRQKNLISDPDFLHSLDTCVERNTVDPINGKFELNRLRKESFDKAYLVADNCRKLVEKNLKEHIAKETGYELRGNELNQIVDAVERTLTKDVYENSINLASENLTFEQLVEKIENSEPAELINKTLDEIISEERVLLKREIVGGIKDYFKKLPAELKEFLRSINSNVILNQILNIDPSIAQKQLEWYSHRRLYLDTNVLLAYFFEAQKCHSITKEVINASKDIGVQFFISPATLIELRKQVERAKRDYIIVDRSKVIRSVAIWSDDAILSTFLTKRKKQPSLDWIAYITPFDDFEEILLENEIVVEKDGMAEIENNPLITEIRKAITDSKPPFTSPNVIEHDAVNYSIILTQRKKYPPDERGQILWLLTLDSSLKRAQQILQGARIVDRPYSVQVGEWGEIVLPIQGLLNLKFTDFIGYLAQSKLGAISDPEIINFDFAETIVDSPYDITRLQSLEPNHVRKVIIKLQTDREARPLIQNLKLTNEPKERERLLVVLNEKVEQAISDTDPLLEVTTEYDKRIDRLVSTINEQGEKITSLQNSLREVTTTWWNRVFVFLHSLFKF